MPADRRLLLGIDTGGTYTDAVLFDHDLDRVVARAKSPTTHDDLSVGIAGAIDAVLAHAPLGASSDIVMVGLSTTLATNALVEGRGRPVGAIVIGFDERVLERAGLRDALAGDPAFFVAGGHDTHGGEVEPLDVDALRAAVDACAAAGVDAVAITAQFSVRNPRHELAARAMVNERLGLPVSCSHELAEGLNGPKRAVTTVLNARLVSVIHDLVATATASLGARGIDAPLMVVRGDGSLVSAQFVRERPIETILSGPAASLVGAAHLSGRPDAIVCDIGGTTTDVALMAAGRPVISDDGAEVGGHRTMVRAVAMRTQGLGGDSEVAHDDRLRHRRLIVGPRRVLPLALLESTHPAILDALERQRRADTVSDLTGVFLVASSAGELDRTTDRLERELIGRLVAGPMPATELLTTSLLRRAADRLVRRGVVRRSSFTPTDAAHVLGLQNHLPDRAARLGAELFARRRTTTGSPIAADGLELAQATIDAVVRRSGEAALAAAFAADGLSVESVQSELVQRSLDRSLDEVAASVSVRLPVIALGASAASLYPMVGALLGAEVVVPVDADVANAVGAVVGRVTISHTATMSAPGPEHVVVHAGGEPKVFADRSVALDFARSELSDRLAAQMADAGAPEFETAEVWTEDVVDVGGLALFVSGRLVMTASGRPILGAVMPTPASTATERSETPSTATERSETPSTQHEGNDTLPRIP